MTDSHHQEFSDNGRKFHGLKVIIPDGTKISLSRSESALEKFGEGYGHYPQCLAVGFFELSTRTFIGFKTRHMNTAERSLAYEHMKEQDEKSLYLADAGYNGMAYIALGIEAGHEVLMPLKMSALVKLMKKSKERSAIHEIKITRAHLKNYPNHMHLLGTIIKVRLIRTLGTSKLASQVLITTLVDEKKFKWRELSLLYRQRYLVEVAFRHLKQNLCIESIRKRKLSRIEKSLYAAIAPYNLATILRNRIKVPEMMPEKQGAKMYCLSYCLDRVCLFCTAIISPQKGRQKAMANCLRALKNCWFLHKPWRASPRICHTPPSKFTVQKGKEKKKEMKAADFLAAEYKILGVDYGQIPA